MGRLLFLEPFDQAAPDLADLPPSADWLAGHAVGLAEGTVAANTRQAALRDDVAQALIDLSFTYAEARTQVLSSLVPLFAMITDKLLPELARQAVLPHLLEHIQAAALSDSAAPMRISAHPSVLSGLSASLPPAIPLPLSLEGDPMLLPGEILLRHRSRETTLDLDGLLQGIRTVLAALFDETERKAHHG